MDSADRCRRAFRFCAGFTPGRAQPHHQAAFSRDAS